MPNRLAERFDQHFSLLVLLLDSILKTGVQTHNFLNLTCDVTGWPFSPFN